MCLMSILAVKVKHHARIKMINTFLVMVIFIYTRTHIYVHTVFIRTVYNIKQKKENERIPVILYLSECQTN